MKKYLNQKNGMKSLYAVLIVLAVVILLLVNVVAGALDDKYNLSFDLTSNRAFELKNETLDYIKNLGEPVQIRVLAQEERFADTSIYNAQANEVMKAFAKNSSQITMEYVDYVKNPGLAAQYPDLTIKHGDILVESRQRYQLIPTEELFNYERNASGKLTIVSSKAEEAVARAVLHVTSTDMPKVMILTGHEEDDITGFQKLLTYNNYEVVSGQLATQDIGSSVDVAVLAAPKSDYSMEELEKLEAFLVNNGEYGKTLLYSADAAQTKLPVLESFLSEWGVEIGDGMVFETDQNRVYQYQPFYGIVDYVNEDYASKLKNQKASLLMPVSRPLKQLFEYQENYKTSLLLQFGESSGVRPSDAGDNFKAEDAAVKGPIPAMILCSYQQSGKQNSMEAKPVSHILVSGSTQFLEESILNTDAFSNASYMVQVLNDLCEKDSGIVVEDKSLAGTALNITRRSADTLGNIFVFVIPLTVLIAGCGVWFFRRHK